MALRPITSLQVVTRNKHMAEHDIAVRSLHCIAVSGLGFSRSAISLIRLAPKIVNILKIVPISLVCLLLSLIISTF